MKKCDQDKMVFTAYITLKNGKRLYAKQVGKKAFCFLDKKSKEQRNGRRKDRPFLCFMESKNT